MTIIKPTAGRIVLYKPSRAEHISAPDAGGFLAAIIAYVHSDSMVNLSVISANGVPTPRTNVLLIQEGQAVPEGSGYCCWMPYQIAQAARAEAAEKAS